MSHRLAASVSLHSLKFGENNDCHHRRTNGVPYEDYTIKFTLNGSHYRFRLEDEIKTRQTFDDLSEAPTVVSSDQTVLCHRNELR